MRAETETTQEPLPRRAGTLSAVGTMAAIALVSVVLVVVWARVGGGQSQAEEDGVVEPIPSQMAGGVRPGRVPEPVVDALGEVAVVGVASVDRLPEEVAQQCSDSFGEIQWDEGQPKVEYAYMTPDGLSASLIGSGKAPRGMFGGKPGGGGRQPERFRMACNATEHDGFWNGESQGIEPVFDGGDGGGHSFGGGYSCCDENGLATASGSVGVPDGATWALQDRNGWYLAYPVDGRTSLSLSWKFREAGFGGGGPPPPSGVTFVDDEGTILEETFAGGQF